MSESIHLVCPHCQGVNRIPAERLQDNPACGKCHQAIYQQQPLEVGHRSFQKHLGRNDIPVLVDFWAPWCGPCQMMAPALAEATATLEPGVRVLKLNTEQEQALGAQFGIRSIPTLALFKSGREVARQSGAMGAADIVRWTRSYLD